MSGKCSEYLLLQSMEELKYLLLLSPHAGYLKELIEDNNFRKNVCSSS